MSNLEVQQKLIQWGLLDPPADGIFGSQSGAALSYARELWGLPHETDAGTFILSYSEPIPLRLDNSLASRIIKYMQSAQYHISRGDKHFNIVYLEGADEDGSPNSDIPNQWNDLRLVLEIKRDGVPRIVGAWMATTEPGRKYTESPMNPDGAFRIAFGQYKAWVIGTHKDHEALIQAGEITGFRDANKDYKRTGDRRVTGSDFGVDQHWGYNMTLVEGASAGCLVGQSKDGHREFMATIKTDRRYLLNPNYVFLTTVIAGDDLAAKFPPC